MGKIIMCSLVLCYGLNLMGQEKSGEVKEKKIQHEVGLVLKNLDNFGLMYRVGNERAVWRVNVLSLGGNSLNRDLDSNSINRSSYNYSVGLGREYRKFLSEKMEFRYGADVSYRYSRNRNDFEFKGAKVEQIRVTYNVGFNAVLGLNYLLNENVLFGLEVLPGVSYYSNINNSDDKEEGFNFSGGTSSAMLSLAYRFK